MTDKPENFAAFPCVEGRPTIGYIQEGMTMRDWFAGHAPNPVPLWFLQEYGSDKPVEDVSEEEVYFKWRWHYADAMLKARENDTD